MDFECPRCARPVTHDYFGPCPSCRSELRTALTRAPVDVQLVEYEPKMNVTPNGVATRDD